MKKSQFHFLPNGTPEVPVVEVPQEDSPNKNVLDEIFKVDPATGLPCNAQQVFLSPDTNPMIKDFIASVLKGTDKPRLDSTFKDLPDDVVSELTINYGETRTDYVNRVGKYLESQKSEIRDLMSKTKEVKEVKPKVEK